MSNETLRAIEKQLHEVRVGSRQHFLFARAAYIQVLRDEGKSLETIGAFANVLDLKGKPDVLGVKKILRDNEAIRDGQTIRVRHADRKDS